MSDSIQVAIKVRPLIKREKDESLSLQWSVQGNSIAPIDPELRKRGDGGFLFDHIFDRDKMNIDVFNVVVKPIVDAAVSGFNGTVFAYGQTSSGKTYTMMGVPNEPGIIPLAIEYMFDAIANTVGREFLLRVSYLEIYNERVNDLLNKDNTDLKVHEDINGQVNVKCKEEVTNCPENVLSIMKKGDKRRRIGETNMNERSSRSHTIFRITIESREAVANSDGAIQVSQLNLVDLAGSERTRLTGATGERFKEGRHINMSLSSLGLVIMQLSESQDNSKHVNFRDSKLTRILQASLGGNAMTAIICAITPAALEETQCTLAFASRAKSVKNKPQLNEVMSDATLLKRYAKQLAKLNAELEKAKQVNRCAEVEEMESKLQEKDRINQFLEERIELLKTRIVSGVNSNNNESLDNKFKRRRTWGGPSTFRHSTMLPTINELDYKEISGKSDQKQRIKRRQSIIQTSVSDIVNEKFQTAVEDFELELIESEKNWERGRYSEDGVDFEEDCHISKRKPANCVKFMDNVSIHRLSYDNTDVTSDSSLSPPRSNIEMSPGTPREILRNRISYLMDELHTLQEFTTLEKQLFIEDCVKCKHMENDQSSNYMKKSLADTEMMYLELNKKYSELKSEHLQLTLEHEDTVKECEKLREKVDSVCIIQSKLDSMVNEKNLIQSTLNETLKKLKNVEGERTDYAFQVDMLREKHKAREQELENALQVAWKEHPNTMDKEQVDNVIHLQPLVDSLRKEIENLQTKLEAPVSADHPVYTENRNITAKLEELNKSLKNTEIEKASLTKQLNELSQSSKEQLTSIEMALQQEMEKLNLHKTELEKNNADLKNQLIAAFTCIKSLTEGSSKSSVLTERLLSEDENMDLRKLNLNMEEKGTDVTEQLGQFKGLIKQPIYQNDSSLVREEELNIDLNKVKVENSQICSLDTADCTRYKINLSNIDYINEAEHRVSNLFEEFEQQLSDIFTLCTNINETDHNIKVLKDSLVNLRTKFDASKTELINYKNFIRGLIKNELNFKVKNELIDKDGQTFKSTVELENLLRLNDITKEDNDNITKVGVYDISNHLEMNEVNKEFDDKQKYMTNLTMQDKNASTVDSKDELENVNIELTRSSDMQNNLDEITDTLEKSELRSKLLEAEDKCRNNQDIIDSLKLEIDGLKFKLEEKNAEFFATKNKFEELQKINAEIKLLSKETNAENMASPVDIQEELEFNKNRSMLVVAEIEMYKSEIANLKEIIAEKANEVLISSKTIEKIRHENKRLNTHLKSLLTNLTTQNITEQDTAAKLDLSPEVAFEQLYIESVGSSKEVQNISYTLEETDVCSIGIARGAENKSILKDVRCNDATDLKSKISIVEANDQNQQISSNELGAENDIVKNDVAKETYSILRTRLDEVILENTELKSKIEIFVQEMVEQVSGAIDLDSLKISLAKHLSERDVYIRELQTDNANLKEQNIALESDIKLCKDEKCVMEKIIKEQEEKLQIIPKLKSQIIELSNEKTELERKSIELHKAPNENTLEPNVKSTLDYESKIQSLNDCIVNLQSSIKDVEAENSELRNQLHKLSTDCKNKLISLREQTEEQEHVLHVLEEDKQILTERIDKLQETETTCTPDTSINTKNATTKRDSTKLVEESHKSTPSQNEKEPDSIFNNSSYFENINSSYNDSVFEEETQNVADTSLFEDITKSNNLLILKKQIKELEDANKCLKAINKEFLDRITDKQEYEYMNKVQELITTVISLENGNAKLAEDLKMKIQESNEIKNDIQELKLQGKKVQQTVHLLTIENMDLSNKLCMEKEHTKEVEDTFQNSVDNLYARISKITEEKAILENDLAICKEQLEIQRTTVTAMTEEEVQTKCIEFEEKIDRLTSENIKLSTNLMEQIEELDKIKESKALLYNHECTYKQEVDNLLAKYNKLENENIELANNLMEITEENDSVKKTSDLLKNKLEVFTKSQLHTSTSCVENDIDLMKMENNQLKAKNIELNTKVTMLSEENTKLSENLLETMEKLDNERRVDNLNDKTLHLSTKHDNSVFDLSEKSMIDDNVPISIDTVKLLQKKITYLTYLNTKLSDLKLSSCSQCTHIKEVNENRRDLKVEVKRLNHKLQDMERKFKQKCADTKELRSKANDDLNLSVCDITLNGSMTEGLSVSFVEEKVQVLNNQLETLKEDHNKLSNLYTKKCNELEKLHDSSIGEVSSSQINSDSPHTNKTKETIDRIQKDINNLSEDLQHLKKDNASIRTSVHQYINEKLNMQNEINLLRSTNEELDAKLINTEISAVTAEEKVKILDNEITDLNQEIERLRTFKKEEENRKLTLEAEVECLKAEKEDNEKLKTELDRSLLDLKEINFKLSNKLETVRKEREELIKYKTDVQNIITEKENKLKEINADLNKYVNDNDNLQAEITILRATVQNDDINSMMHNSNDSTKCNIDENLKENNTMDYTKLLSMYEKLNKESESVRTVIIKEIKALESKTDTSNLSEKSVKELFRTFLRTVMLKEREIIKVVEDRFERDRQKLEDEKRQCQDAEKRAIVWAKELEAEIKKLQDDLSVQEDKSKGMYDEIKQLGNLLQECNHEKQLLKEKIEVLETDFNSMQIVLDKQTRADVKQDEANNAAQERERLVLETVKKREAELQSRFDSEKEHYGKKVEELTHTVENYKTKNMDLQSNLEGLEASEKNLKNIINVKSNDLTKSYQKIKNLETELEQLTNSYNELNRDNSSKIQRIEEITNLLKAKCDMLSEFKTKFETLTPEYNALKEQLRERKVNSEKYKYELDALKLESEKQINIMKDKLDAEEIKSGGLNKQIIQLGNKNTDLLMDLEKMREKCDELERSNAKLAQKMRNSTSKIKVEARVEELQDQIKMLQNNLEGASNRIAELQDTKGQVMRDLIELRGEYEALSQENNEMRSTMTVNRTKQMTSDLIELRGKYEVLLQEKNKIALSLEEKKLLLIQSEKEVTNYKNEIVQLREKNKELDEEMDDMVKVIEELRIDNAVLTDKLFAPETSKRTTEEQNAESQVTICGSSLSRYKDEIERLKRHNKEQQEKISDMLSTIDTLRKEKNDLHAKMLDLETSVESKGGNNSRSSSPLFEITRRKQRRSDLFNQKRQLENARDSDGLSNEDVNCRCTVLKQKVRDLELELVSKNGKIATLEIQIQSENFPYQRKCKDLEESLLTFKNKNVELRTEVKRLNRAMMETNVRDCELCRRRNTNKRDQFTQCMPEYKTFLSGTSSGLIDNHLQDQRIRKLEEEKELMKGLCRFRIRRIKELEEQVKELEAVINPDNAVPIESVKKNISIQSTKSSSHRLKSPHALEQNSWRAMKENIPTKVLDTLPGMSLKYGRNAWNGY